VRSDRDTMIKDPRWLYNDIAKGFDEAKKSGKPLLVVIRCVPCKGCMGIDASILSSKELQPVLDQFVCLRIINANALDLSLFQFDYDLSLSTLIFNGDGTVYGRFGSWQHQRDAMDDSTTGYKATLEGALTLHRAYPANKDSLASKQGGPTPFKIPIEIPALAGKYQRELNWEGKVVPSCVHCHQIGEAFRATYRDKNKPIPQELIYPMPAPDTIGLSLDTAKPGKVNSVAEGSTAAAAGVQKGDEVVSANGAPNISVADFAWALHHSPDSGSLKVKVRRDGAEKELTIALADGWRLKSDIGTRVGSWQMRAMAFGGLKMDDLTDAERDARKLDHTSMALLVKWPGGGGGIHGAAIKEGFKKDDVLVSIDGRSERASESEMFGLLLLKYPEKGKVKATVLRGDKKIDLMLPMQ